MKTYTETHRSIRSLVAQSSFNNKPQLLALVSRCVKNRTILQTIVDRSKLLEREQFLSNDLALILVYDAIFGVGVRGKFKGVIKRNQTSFDKCVKKLVRDRNLNDSTDLVTTLDIHDPNLNEIKLPRYCRINLLKTTAKQIQHDLKVLEFKRLRHM
ncbi:unnamed protein product [Didymodactylos carnosus]|uniref:NSUN5/RCM1 N-terminal domain-containing protein n=1 Tax=Didymodactylos carnosus TaxID=1234261 RepID=A0A813T4D3_9BILA|nr:unnamed protein product [Didymodactylos carnosus]CAF0915968.1 unnamed protein product [Didymodactylos carnosus]CAF3591551.1 unnamed protein product [Didymodactylos carnosus]CAF3694166.1 unnamed protein product [Didymodactylos carnosus]